MQTRPVVLASLLAAVFVTGCADRTPSLITLQSPNPLAVEHPGTMTVTGTATLDVSPDCADLTMTLSMEAPRPGAATAGVQVKEDALVAALGKLGVSNEDLKLSYLSMSPVYEPDTSIYGAPAKLHGYRADITVTATTHDFGKLADLMDAGADAGATSMSSAFRRSDLPELKKKVRDLALAAARAKATQTATALDIKLGRITSVAEAPNGQMWGNAYFPQATANVAEVRAMHGTLGGALEQLTLDVTIGYELAKET